MRWSKVRKLVEDSFTDSVKGRITVHSTQYRRSNFWGKHVRGWIAIDRRHVANFDDHLVQTLHGAWLTDWQRTGDDSEPGALHGAGFFGQEFTCACFVYTQSSVAESLNSPSPIIRALALLNAKVGRQRLTKYAAAETHPLPKALAEFRMGAEEEVRSAARAAAR